MVTTPPVACVELVPETWTQGVGGVPIPVAVPADFGLSGCSPLAEPARTYCADAQRNLEASKRYANAYLGEAGQREKADGRTADTIQIIRRCEQLVSAATRRR